MCLPIQKALQSAMIFFVLIVKTIRIKIFYYVISDT